MKKEEKKKRRQEYQRVWQENYRKLLASRGLKQIRLVIHRDFEAEIREIARQDIAKRLM